MSRFLPGENDRLGHAFFRGASVSRRSDGRKEWVADTGGSHHTTGIMNDEYNVQAPPRGRESVILGDGIKLPMRAVSRLNLRFHMGPAHGADATSFCLQFTKSYVLDGVRLNFFLCFRYEEDRRSL